MKRTITSVIVCCANVLLAWYGLHGVVSAFNVYKFVTIASFILGLIAVLGKAAIPHST